MCFLPGNSDDSEAIPELFFLQGFRLFKRGRFGGAIDISATFMAVQYYYPP